MQLYLQYKPGLGVSLLLGSPEKKFYYKICKKKVIDFLKAGF